MADFYSPYDHAGNIWKDEVGNVWQVFNCDYIVEDIIDQTDVESIYGKKKYLVSDFIVIESFDEVDDFDRL